MLKMLQRNRILLYLPENNWNECVYNSSSQTSLSTHLHYDNCSLDSKV